MLPFLKTTMRILNRTAKISCFAILSFVLTGCVLLFVASCAHFTPDDYVEKVKTGGALEKTYLATGSYDVEYFEQKTDDQRELIQIYYPSAMTKEEGTWPAVVFVNGTGVFASKYPALFRHLASWGFVVIGNEDPSTFSGKTANETMKFLLDENEREGSVFYHKINRERLGISGHSQGGVGVFNATQTAADFGFQYAAAVSLSPTQEDWAAALRIPYDPTKTNVPILVVAATKNDVISKDGMKRLFEKTPSERVVVRRKCQSHGETLYVADGYVTAWFMSRLKDDSKAKGALEGDVPEIADNPLYTDLMIGNAKTSEESNNSDRQDAATLGASSD